MDMDKKYTSRDFRSDLIKKFLSRYKGTNIFCPAIGYNVYINSDSIEEIAWHGSKSVNSTFIALNLEYSIKNAKYINPDKPKNNKQINKFHFFRVYILECEFKEGIAKIVVGKDKRFKIKEYCITKKDEK